jgi:serine phosphatase RsbU (regulator of sigma subunit)
MKAHHNGYLARSHFLKQFSSHCILMKNVINKGSVGVAVFLVISLIILDVIVTHHNNQIIEENRLLQKQAEEIKVTVSQFAIVIIHNLDLGLRGYALFHHDRFLYPLKFALRDKDSILNAAEKSLVLHQYPLAEFYQLKDSINAYVDLTLQMKDLYEHNQLEELHRLANLDKGYHLWLQYELFARKIYAYEDGINEKAKERYYDALRDNYLVQVLLFLLCVPTILFTAFHTSRRFAIVEKLSSLEAEKAQLLSEQNQTLEKLVQERTAEVVEQKEILQAQAEYLQLVNTELKEQREEIEVQRDNMERINAQMMSSIQYAHTIQQAILPSQRRISQYFPQHFILYRPKDVVSGDFYWFAHLDSRETGLGADLSFMAVVDCTGHGVPGAFMSIIGSTLLNEIVKLKHILDPARILEELSEGVRTAVEKSDNMKTAGMDVCLLRLQRGESDQLQLQYAGAKRPLLWVSPHGQQVETLAGERHSIGSEPSTQMRFTTQELLLEKGTSLYLTSDGYTDQNNPERLKIGSPRLRELIMKAVGLPVAQQRIMFEKELLEHQREAEQRDDITLVGIVL